MCRKFRRLRSITFCEFLLSMFPSHVCQLSEHVRPFFHRAYRRPQGGLNDFRLPLQQTCGCEAMAKSAAVPLQAVILQLPQRTTTPGARQRD